MTDCELTSALESIEIARVQQFRLRFEKLWANFEDLKSLSLNLSGNFELLVGRQVDGGEIGVNRFRLKGYLMDYRQFYETGPVNFFSTCNIIKRRCFNEERHDIVKENKRSWKKAGFLSGWYNQLSCEEFFKK